MLIGLSALSELELQLPDFGKPFVWDFIVKIEFDVSDKLYPRANPPANLRPIAPFALKIAHFVCDRATTIRNEKLRSKGVAMHVYGLSVYHACTGNQLSRLGQSRPK